MSKLFTFGLALIAGVIISHALTALGVALGTWPAAILFGFVCAWGLWGALHLLRSARHPSTLTLVSPDDRRGFSNGMHVTVSSEAPADGE